MRAVAPSSSAAPKALLLALALWHLPSAAPGLRWQENLRPKLFCAMTPRDYVAFAGAPPPGAGANASGSHFTALFYTDFTESSLGAGEGRSEAPSINTPYSTSSPSSGPAQTQVMAGGGGTLLIGARDIVYKLSVPELRLRQTLHWPASESARDTCVVKGKTPEMCRNFIVVVQQYDDDPTRFLFCGTNAFSPSCRDYADERSSFVLRDDDRGGVGAAPFDPAHNSTAVLVGGQLYAGTVADFAGVDSIVFRAPLRTQQYDSKQLNAPDFVGSLWRGDHVFFFFREAAVERINCGKAVLSRVARVCRNDRGGPHKAKYSWTTFLKTRLNCSVPGDYPFYFDEIQGVSELVRGKYGGGLKGASSEEIVYGTFSTQPNSIGGSAVCAFRMKDIQAAFEGRFKVKKTMNW